MLRVAAVIMAIGTIAHADTNVYLEPSAWAGVKLAGPFVANVDAQLSIGLESTNMRADHEIEDSFKIGLWLDSDLNLRTLSTVSDRASGHVGVDVSYDHTIGCSCVRIGPHFALATGAEDNVWVVAGGRVRYRWAWAGLDASYGKGRISSLNGSTSSSLSFLQLGVGVNLHPSIKQVAIGSGVVALAFVALLAGAAAVP